LPPASANTLKTPRTFWKQVLLVFAVVAVGYFLVFSWIEQRRHRLGPWQVTFATDGGTPTLRIAQSALQLTDVTVRFTGAASPALTPQTIRFEPGRPVPFDLPFGRCVFQDALFLPGTVACQIFGHEIQLMPRKLTIDGVERAWHSGDVIELSAHLEGPASPRQPQ
jgi:hypothetical protein